MAWYSKMQESTDGSPRVKQDSNHLTSSGFHPPQLGMVFCIIPGPQKNHSLVRASMAHPLHMLEKWQLFSNISTGVMEPTCWWRVRSNAHAVAAVSASPGSTGTFMGANSPSLFTSSRMTFPGSLWSKESEDEMLELDQLVCLRQLVPDFQSDSASAGSVSQQDGTCVDIYNHFVFSSSPKRTCCCKHTLFCCFE